MAAQLAMFSSPELSGLAGVFDRAADEWGLNCGPGAICGALAMYPELVRGHLDGFERRGYMSPTHMWAALKSLGVERELLRWNTWPISNGICRVQWGGPWCDKGRPAIAAYRHTHWIAARRDAASGTVWIFDVNNLIGPGLLSESGWLPHDTWAGGVVPHLLRPPCDGSWWITHTAELRRGS